MKNLKKKYFYLNFGLFFAVFGILPFLIPLTSIVNDDSSFYLRYLFLFFPMFLIVFFIVMLKKFGIIKKNIISLIGFTLLYYILAIAYIFIRIAVDFSDFRSSSF